MNCSGGDGDQTTFYTRLINNFFSLMSVKRKNSDTMSNLLLQQIVVKEEDF